MNNQDETNNNAISVSESNDNMIIPIVNIVNNENSNILNPSGGIQLTGEMQVELNRINDKLKLLLPFIILVFLKNLLDNFVTGLIVIINIYILYKIQIYFSIQLSLKDRSSKNILLCLLASVVGLLSIDLFLINILFSNGTLFIFERLQLKYPNIKSNIPFLSIVWYCFITDGLLQMLSIIIKLIICIIVDSKNCYDPTKWRMNTIFYNINQTNLHTTSLRLHGNTPSNDSYDIENGFISTTANVNSTNTTNHNNNIAYTTLSNLSSSISGLVHRSLLHQTQRQQQHNNYRIENNNDIVVNTIHDDTTSSDVDINELQSRQSSSESYLIRLRLCTLIDMLCLIYRTIIPIPLWSYYFATSKFFGVGLKLTYIFIKLLDLSWKTKGIIVAFDIFFRNKLEFGHYSTLEELQSGYNSNNNDINSNNNNNNNNITADCPICFDKYNKPITLECTHIFCEVCISEWIDKEKTCPVCRADVHCVSSVLHAMKEAATVKHPLII